MKIKTIDDAPLQAKSVNTKKQLYKSPLFRVYGAVHQFTQGTKTNGSDAGFTMGKNP